MFSLQNLTIFVIVIIVILSISIIINKVIIDNINNEIKLTENINTLRILLWLNYTIVTILTMYLMYRVFNKIYIINNLNIFVPNTIVLLLNLSLTVYIETLLKTPTEDKLKKIYITTSITTMINILNIILLLYKFNYILRKSSSNISNEIVNIKLSTPTFTGISGKFTKINEITPEEIRQITPKEIRQITPEEIRQITPEEIRQITPEEINEITPEKIRQITPKEIRQITPKEIRQITPEEIKERKLKSYQLDYLSKNLQNDIKKNEEFKAQLLVKKKEHDAKMAELESKLQAKKLENALKKAKEEASLEALREKVRLNQIARQEGIRK
jgi:hypothetical protein